jgi:riboflavin kinase/FMN adenylyltransferase
LPAVMNVGTRPTFEGDGQPQAEAHLLDFKGDVYGRRVELSFSARLREERRFAGVDALREQIAVDVVAARGILGLP